MAADNRGARRSTRMSLNGTGSNGLQLGGSSVTMKHSTASENTKENSKEDTLRLAKEKVAKKKRAASVGGSELQALLKETQSQILAPTSRRNAPRPRKSAIRAIPQVFESPTGLVPSPKARQGLALKPLVASPEKNGASRISDAASAAAAPSTSAAHVARDATQTIAAFGPQDPTMTLNDARGCATQVVRAKRRVTFSKRQEKTEFARDEPTLRLGSLRNQEPATPSTTQGSSSMGRSFDHSDSDSDSDSDPDSDESDDASAMVMATTSDMMLTASSYGNASSDMDMSMEHSTDDSLGGAEEGDNATKSMEITAAHGQIRKRKLSGFPAIEPESDLDDSYDAPGELDPTLGDSSNAMDFTEAVGGAPLLKRRRSSVAQLAADRAVLMDNEQADDITASRAGITFTHAASDESADSARNDDESAMMDFTTPMGLRGADLTAESAGSEDDGANDNIDMSASMDVTKPLTTIIRTKGAETGADDTTEEILAPRPDDQLNGNDDDSADELDHADGTMTRGDQSMAMELTRAMTGRIEQKDADAASSDVDDDDDDDGTSMELDQTATMQSTMEMTKAIGRITAHASASMTSAEEGQNGFAVRAASRSPRKSMGSHSLAEGASMRLSSEPDARAGSPSKFRQSLRGGVESPAYTRSPARRVGGSQPPPGRPSLNGVAASSFRQSLIGGVESPGYLRSPARRVQASPVRTAATAIPGTAASLTPSKPTSSGLIAGLSLSARKRSPSPATRAVKRAAMGAGRKSLGSNLTSLSHPFRPQPHAASKDPRLARSSIIAAVLPDHSRFKDESFASASPSELADLSASEVYGDEVHGKVGESSYSLNDDGAPFNMPLNAFLTHVGVQFHEDMSAVRRRPVPVREGDSSTDGDLHGAKTPAGLIRLVKAACGAVPQLEALRDACREIKEQVEDGRDRLAEMEAAFYSNPPDFVREIMCLSNDEEKKEMEAQFKLQKQAARALAVSDYYGWRMDKEFDVEMVQTLQAYHGRLQCDLQIVEEKREELSQRLLPTLRSRHLELERELSAARQRQREIEECDQDELKSLYASIEEQHEVLEGMRANLDETKQSHERVLTRLHENQEKIASTTEMIAKARAVCDQIQGCTRGEARRLLREVRNLEKLHLVRIVHVSAKEMRSTVEVVVDGWLLVSMHLDLEKAGAVESVSLRSVESEGVESTLVRKAAVQILQDEFEREKPRQAALILRRVSKTLIRHRHLLAEIEHLRCRFPLELLAASGGKEEEAAGQQQHQHLSLRASVLLPRQRSKIIIEARSNLACSGANQPTFEADSVKVETVYGSADALAMSAQILDCLAADPTIGSLSRACLETVETFDV